MKNHQNTTKNTMFNRYSIESIVHEHKFTKYKVDYFLLRFSENENTVYFFTVTPPSMPSIYTNSL